MHLASSIEHTLLRPDATPAEITKLCQVALEWKFVGVCVNSIHIELAAKLLAGSPVKPITVVGFPLGACLTSVKAFETRQAISLGAREIDMVIQVGALKSNDKQLVITDIRAVCEAAHPYPVKVILETALLTQQEIIIGCTLAKSAGAQFVKTSTGFLGPGASVSNVKLMRETVGNEMGIKASGGIRSYEDAEKLLHAGANRLGTSASVAIMTGRN